MVTHYYWIPSRQRVVKSFLSILKGGGSEKSGGRAVNSTYSTLAARTNHPVCLTIAWPLLAYRGKMSIEPTMRVHVY